MLTGTQLTVRTGTALALTVCQHVGDIACLASVNFPDLIKHHGGIVAAAGASLQRVAGGPPCLPVVRPAADGGCRFHGGGLTVCRFPFEVVAAAVHTNQP